MIDWCFINLLNKLFFNIAFKKAFKITCGLVREWVIWAVSLRKPIQTQWFVHELHNIYSAKVCLYPGIFIVNIWFCSTSLSLMWHAIQKSPEKCKTIFASLVCHLPHSVELTYRSVIVQLCRFCWISPLKPTLLWRVMRGLYSIFRGWVRLTHSFTAHYPLI